MNVKELRTLIAEEADKIPLRIQLVPRKHEPAEVIIGALANLLLGGLLLMWGLRAAHQLFEAVPAAGYVDSVFLIAGLNALGSALGWARMGAIR